MDNTFAFLLKTAVKFKTAWSSNITISIDEETLKAIAHEFDIFPIDSMSEFIEDDIILVKDAAILELITMRFMPLRTDSEIINERINAQFAMSLATTILFGTNDLILNTRQYISVDVPFENSLENHLTWLRQVQFKETLPTLTFSNATFWTLISIIFNNKHNFISV